MAWQEEDEHNFLGANEARQALVTFVLDFIQQKDRLVVELGAGVETLDIITTAITVVEEEDKFLGAVDITVELRDSIRALMKLEVFLRELQ